MVSTLSILLPSSLPPILFLSFILLALAEVGYHVLRLLRQPASNHLSELGSGSSPIKP